MSKSPSSFKIHQNQTAIRPAKLCRDVKVDCNKRASVPQTWNRLFYRFTRKHRTFMACLSILAFLNTENLTVGSTAASKTPFFQSLSPSTRIGMTITGKRSGEAAIGKKKAPVAGSGHRRLRDGNRPVAEAGRTETRTKGVWCFRQSDSANPGSQNLPRPCAIATWP